MGLRSLSLRRRKKRSAVFEAKQYIIQICYVGNKAQYFKNWAFFNYLYVEKFLSDFSRLTEFIELICERKRDIRGLHEV